MLVRIIIPALSAVSIIAYAGDAEGSHPFLGSGQAGNINYLHSDLQPGGDGRISYRLCDDFGRGVPTQWAQGVEKWDIALGPTMDFDPVTSCSEATDGSTILRWGSPGACITDAIACWRTSSNAMWYTAHGSHRDIRLGVIVFETGDWDFLANPANGFSPNWLLYMPTHEFGHDLSLADHVSHICAANTLMLNYGAGVFPSAPCGTDPTVADRAGVGCSVYIRYCAVMPGTLFKSEGGSAVWVVDGGVNRWIPSARLFEQCGYHWDEIIALRSSTVSMVPNGTNVSTVPCPYTLAQQSGTASVYVIKQAWKHLVPSSQAFDACAYNWGYIVTVASLAGFTTLNAAMPPCDYLRYPPYYGAVMEGQLVQGFGSTNVYLIASGTKRLIPSATAFDACGYKWNDIVVVPSATVNMMSTGQNVGSPPCNHTLVQAPGNPTVYIMEAGQKRAIGSAQVFEACGYSWGEIVAVSSAALNAVSTGSPLNAPPCPFTRPQ